MRKPKLGGKKTLRLFLKGNDDVVNALLSVDEGGGRLPRGLRGLVREKYEGAFDLEVVHEPCGRSDVFLEQLRVSSVAEVDTAPGTRLREQPFDIVVLALQTEIENIAWRHRKEGYLLSPPTSREQEWLPEQRQRFATEFSAAEALTVEQSKENLARIIATVKDELDAHVFVFNCSSIDPDDHLDNYFGHEDNREVRTHKLNLALMQLSVLDGVSIIDVDRLIAELGGEQHVQGWCRYSDEAYAAIGQEFLRVMEDVGFFENRPLVMQVGQRGKVKCS